MSQAGYLDLLKSYGGGAGKASETASGDDEFDSKQRWRIFSSRLKLNRAAKITAGKWRSKLTSFAFNERVRQGTPQSS